MTGSHNKAIAFELGIAHSTVRVLLARAAAKLGVRSRTEVLERVALAHAGLPALLDSSLPLAVPREVA
jgi:DNA-binding NarL/FixJ family response regulator